MEERKITFDDIQKANETIKTTDIKGKDYAEVNQRIKAFRMVYPQGTIKKIEEKIENGICEITVGVYEYYIQEPSAFLSNGVRSKLLATGTAYEKENSSFINKTSYIENCETSAVGRALGMCGFGIDTSVASYEEVSNAINQQEKDFKIEEYNPNKQVTDIQAKSMYKALCNKLGSSNAAMEYLDDKFGIDNTSNLTVGQYVQITEEMKQR